MIDERLVRIETKIDQLLEARQTDRQEAAVFRTDLGWVKSGLALVLTIILSVAGYLAAAFFKP